MVRPRVASLNSKWNTELRALMESARIQLFLAEKTMSPSETLCRRVFIDRVAIIRSMLTADRCRTTTSANVPTNLLSHRSFPDTQNAKGR